MSIESLEEVPNSENESKAAAKLRKTKDSKEKDIKKTTLKKLNAEAAKLLSALQEKANKKDHGRKVRDSEIIHLGLSLIEGSHLETLKESTYSEKDRLAIAHQEYQKTHGKLTLDQFIGKLLKGEIQASSKIQA